MIEYTKGRHTIGLGIGHGKITNKFQFQLPEYGFGGGVATSGKFWKTSIEYGYRVLPLLFRRINLYVQISFSRVSNDHTDWNNPSITQSVDNMGLTVDSTYSNQSELQRKGWLVSASLRGS